MEWKLYCVCLCMIYPDKESSFHPSSVAWAWTGSLHPLSRYWRKAIHAKCANKGRKEELSSAVECCLACWICACMYTHTHTFMYTQRDPEGGEEGTFFSLTLNLTKGVSEFSERAVRIWRRLLTVACVSYLHWMLRFPI